MAAHKTSRFISLSDFKSKFYSLFTGPTFYSTFTKLERKLRKKVRMMRFANSLGNTLSRKSSSSANEASSALCIIQNREYAAKKPARKDDADHAHILAPPPVILGIILGVGHLLHKPHPLAIMADPGVVSKVLAYSLFIIAGLIMVSTTLLMIRKKTDPRPIGRRQPSSPKVSSDTREIRCTSRSF